MALTPLTNSPNPPIGFGPNQRRPAAAAEVQRLIQEIEAGSAAIATITTTGNVNVGGDLAVTGATTLNGTITLGDAAADSLIINATTTYTDPVNYSNQTGITAFATGGQASATALTEEVNNVTTVATAGDSVKLPAAAAGKRIHVKNSGATALDIFPATSDSIDALAVNLAIRIQPGSSVDFYAKDAIVWESTIDQSLTLVSPTTNTGQLELKAAASAGNTVTTITNASQAAARTYTIPDAGASAEFVMNAGASSIAGVKTFTDVTDSTSKDTGAVILEGGIGIELNASVGGDLNLSGNMVLDKEINHSITITTSTTADTVGGNLSITSGKGIGTGNGGSTLLSTGQGGATGNGGAHTINTGAGGATSGDGGDLLITTGNATVGSSGTITTTSGNSASGLAGDLVFTTGTHTSATVEPVISLEKAVVRKPLSSTVASGGTITGPELVRGLITATGATGNWQLPTAAQITTAIGATPAGTNFEFVFNAAAMTGTNTATLVVGAGMTVMSAPAITGGGTLTVTQDTQVVARFWVCFDTATTCKISRVA